MPCKHVDSKYLIHRRTSWRLIYKQLKGYWRRQKHLESSNLRIKVVAFAAANAFLYSQGYTHSTASIYLVWWITWSCSYLEYFFPQTIVVTSSHYLANIWLPTKTSVGTLDQPPSTPLRVQEHPTNVVGIDDSYGITKILPLPRMVDCRQKVSSLKVIWGRHFASHTSPLEANTTAVH